MGDITWYLNKLQNVRSGRRGNLVYEKSCRVTSEEDLMIKALKDICGVPEAKTLRFGVGDAWAIFKAYGQDFNALKEAAFQINSRDKNKFTMST